MQEEQAAEQIEVEAHEKEAVLLRPLPNCLKNPKSKKRTLQRIEFIKKNSMLI